MCHYQRASTLTLPGLWGPYIAACSCSLFIFNHHTQLGLSSLLLRIHKFYPIDCQCVTPAGIVFTLSNSARRISDIMEFIMEEQRPDENRRNMRRSKYTMRRNYMPFMIRSWIDFFEGIWGETMVYKMQTLVMWHSCFLYICTWCIVL